VEQNQREKQTPNNNDNYQPPINNSPQIDNSPKDNQENFPRPQNNSTESANSQIDSDEQREREREQATHGGSLPPPEKQNNLQPEAKKADHASVYLVSGAIGIVIVAVGISLVIAAKKKRNNARRYQK